MREVTYSQGLIIEDSALVATLSIFCRNIWLPYAGVGEAVQDVLTDANPAAAEALRTDPARKKIANWEAVYAELFKNRVVQRLPGPKADSHEHRSDFSDRSVDEIVGGKRSLYERLALRYHFMRANLPGVELFNTGEPKDQVDLATSLFFLNLPKISAEPSEILELRAQAQKADVKQFWAMIEEEASYAKAQNQVSLARAEKIRAEFKQWNEGRFRLRGTSLGIAWLATLAWYWWTPESGWLSAATGLAIGAALSVIPPWLGDLNARWIQRNITSHKAFNCISCVDTKLNELAH